MRILYLEDRGKITFQARDEKRKRAGSKVKEIARHVGTGSGVHMADPNSPAKDS